MAVAVPNVLDALGFYTWAEEAACAGEDIHFPDEALARLHPGSPTLVLPLLICAQCPVREPCLREALTEWKYTHDQLGRTTPKGWDRDPQVSVIAAQGIWGGTTELEREQVRDLPIDEAVEQLEDSFPERLKDRLEAFRQEISEREAGTRGSPKARRILAMLGDVPTPKPSLIGTTEIGNMLGVSKQRADQISREHEDFPDPEPFASDRVWQRSKVEAWIRRHPDRRVGRRS